MLNVLNLCFHLTMFTTCCQIILFFSNFNFFAFWKRKLFCLSRTEGKVYKAASLWKSLKWWRKSNTRYRGTNYFLIHPPPLYRWVGRPCPSTHTKLTWCDRKGGSPLLHLYFYIQHYIQYRLSLPVRDFQHLLIQPFRNRMNIAFNRKSYL